MYHRKAVLEAEIGEELVALDPDAGHCFGFNGVATSVWRQLEQPKTFDQLRDFLIEEYEVDEDECTNELARLLRNLTEHGLVSYSD